MKCPHCEKLVINPNMQACTSSVLMGTPWKCIAFVCPHCQAILSVQIDPLAIKADTVAELLRALRKP